MSIMKRATEKTIHLGIVIQRGLYGFYPSFQSIPPGKHQRSKVFDEINDAVDAVLNGYRPTFEDRGGEQKSGIVVKTHNNPLEHDRPQAQAGLPWRWGAGGTAIIELNGGSMQS